MIDYISGHLWQLWSVIAFLCLIFEMTTGTFYLLCFTVGAVGALLSSFVCGFYAQIVVFAAVSAICVFLARPFAVRYFHHDGEARVSNADAIIGRIGTVTQVIEKDGYGRVAIDGDDWKAVCSAGLLIPAGNKVKVIGRDSLIIDVVPASSVDIA
ncbi:NfeD family protein [Xylanibacter muris]|uniref:NfeD family protein n=1 Tax=Xylanibacter muris TaxID=2736290 RepID=A0ABX2ALN8_9BACT|nr:NfeD family protein [Xylanibacter muris]NPD91167.1 NfeD family protein [Xylanibacter muris]